MKKQRQTIKQLIIKWLGIETQLQMLEQQLDTLERQTSEQISDFEYKLEDKADVSQVDNLESDVSDCVEEWRVDDMIQYAIDDTEIPTREDIQEMITEEQHEMLLDMVKNNIDEIQHKEFDYDLVVSQVVSIIVEKLNN
jgi:hypothetical protein